MVGYILSQPIVRAIVFLAIVIVLVVMGVTTYTMIQGESTGTVVLDASTPTPTISPSPTPTETPVPPTDTPIPPTATPPPTETPVPPTPTPTPTVTPVPPTATPPPTKTPVPPTATPVLPTSTPTPTMPPPPQGLLAYPEYNSTRSTFEVKIYNLDQGRIVETIDQASQPAIGPDAQQVAFHFWDPANLGLFQKDLDQPGSPERISQLSEAYRPRWRDDNGRIVFSFVQGDIRDVRYADRDYEGLPTPGQAKTPAWLPDGRLILNGCIGTHCGLVVTDELGINSDLLTDRTGDLTPAAAPDGRQVAFMSDRDGNWEIYLLDFQSRAITRLTNHPARDGLPIFSPDGSQVAFVSDRDGQWAIWLLDWKRPGSEELLLPIPGGLEGSVGNVGQSLQPGWSYESISWRLK